VKTVCHHHHWMLMPQHRHSSLLSRSTLSTTIIIQQLYLCAHMRIQPQHPLESHEIINVILFYCVCCACVWLLFVWLSLSSLWLPNNNKCMYVCMYVCIKGHLVPHVMQKIFPAFLTKCATVSFLDSFGPVLHSLT